jgi:hypothetical protein
MRKSAPLLSLLSVMIPARDEQGLHSSRARQQWDRQPTLPVEGMPVKSRRVLNYIPIG